MKATLFALILVLVGCGTTPPRTATVFVGDSIFGRLVAVNQFTSSGYVDAGIFGERTDEILARFPDILSGKHVCHGFMPAAGSPPDPDFPLECSSLAAPPKTVVIFAAWNNFFQNDFGTPLADLQQMASMAQANGVKVAICTVYPWDPALPAPWMVPPNATVTFYDVWRIPLNDGIRSIPNVTVVDLSALFAGQLNYTIDGIHPTDAGNVQMFNAINSLL